MIEKYIIMISDNASFGMRYASDTKVVSLGGNSKFRAAMESVITEYFGADLPEMKMVQSNKIRYTFPVEEITKVIAELEEHGFVVQQVTKLGRLMI